MSKNESEIIMERWSKLAGLGEHTVIQSNTLNESQGQFYGKDMESSLRSQLEIAFEDIMMDLDDANVDGAPWAAIDQLLDLVHVGSPSDILELLGSFKTISGEIGDLAIEDKIMKKIEYVEYEILPQLS